MNSYAPFAFVSIFSLAVALASGTAHAQTKTVVPSLGCPLGCGGPESDTQLSNMITRKGGTVTLAPQETPGYVYNIRYMDRSYEKAKATTFQTEDMLLQFGAHGGKELIKDSLPEPIKHHFKFLWQIAANAQGRFFVTFDPAIKTIADMKGKKVNLGLLTQSDFGLAARVVLAMNGVTGENTPINYVSPTVMTDQLINGTIDATTSAILGDPGTETWVTGAPLIKIGAAAQASNRTLRYVSIDEDTVKKINEKYGTTIFTRTLPPGTLPQQTEPVTIGLVRAYHAATPDFPEQTAYELTKAALEYGPELKKEGGVWAFWSKAGMVAGLNECNTHPGALRAFKELGVWELRARGGPEAKIPGC